jgi:beta-glucosidase
MVTLHHVTNPRWLSDKGGWEQAETAERFARFAEQVVGALSHACDLWCTVNEPNCYAYKGYLAGVWPPGKSDLGTALQVARNLMLGHAGAYRLIHEHQPQAKVGFAHSMRVFEAASRHSPLDRLAASLVDRTYNRAILAAIRRGLWMPPLGFGLAFQLRDTLDWIGLNYYARERVAFDRTRPDLLFSRRQSSDAPKRLDGGYGESHPAGIESCLGQLARLDIPIYVTENGVPDANDDRRRRYIIRHLHRMWHAIQHCYPVMGYYHWTLVDNFEWAEGWQRRFGLIHLDPLTQTRTPRPSAELYGELIKANAISPHLIDTHVPELRPELLPGEQD